MFLLLVIFTICTVSAGNVTDNSVIVGDDCNQIIVNSSQSSNDVLSSNWGSVNSGSDLERDEVNFESVENKSNLKAPTYQVTDGSYSNFFNSDGTLMSNVEEGSVLDLSGNFQGKNFTLNKPVTLTSSSGALLTNCFFIVNSGGSGSILSNLNVIDDGYGAYAFTLNGADRVVLRNNIVSCKGHGGFTITLLPDSDFNIIENNTLITNYTSTDYFHSTVILFASDNNILRDNFIYTGDSNGIYLSTYGRSNGVKSNFNNISNNTVVCLCDTPSSWNYAIQVMGDYNNILGNCISNSYRGISTTSGYFNNISSNLITNTNGECAIYASYNSKVFNNTILNCNGFYGVYVLPDSRVFNNTVNVIGDVKGVQVAGSNITIRNNIISSENSYTVYCMGDYSNIIIDSNTISSNTGNNIVIKKQSTNKYPKNVTITNNIISSNAKVAIDAGDTDKSLVMFNNTINGDGVIIQPSINTNKSDNGSSFDGNSYYINNSNFNNYFDSNGNIITGSLKDGDTIFFNGDFYNKTVIINHRLKVLGNNPFFYNSTFKITSSSCDIEGLNIINNNPDAIDQWGIYVYSANNVKIVNNYINVTDKYAAYGIYLYDSGNSNVSYNTVISNGKYLTYTILAYAVDSCSVSNNNIVTTGTGELYNFTNEVCIDGLHNVVEVYRTYGVLFLYSSNNLILNNNVNLSSDLTKAPVAYNESTNSLVGIDIYFDSHNNTVKANNISVNAYDPFMYGAGVLGGQTGTGTSTALNNKFLNNNIYLNGTYFVTGIITGYNSINTTVSENLVNVYGKDYAYGITLEASQMNFVNRNTVFTKSIVNYVMELFDSDNNLIEKNNLTGQGAYVYGLGAYSSTNNNILGNIIYANGKGKDIPLTGLHMDTLVYGNSGVILSFNSDNNLLKSNTIISTKGYAVNSTNSTNNTVCDNLLKTSNLSGNRAVYPQTNLVYDNYGDVSNSLSISNFTEKYGDAKNLTGHYYDSMGNPISGQHIALNLTNPLNGASKVYWVTTDTNGEYQLEINLSPGTYTARANVGNLSTDLASIKVVNQDDNQDLTVLSANSFNETFNAGKNFTGALKDSNGNLLIGQHISIKLTRLSDGASKVYWATTDTNGEYQLSINLYSGEYTAQCAYSGTNKYSSSSIGATITVNA